VESICFIEVEEFECISIFFHDVTARKRAEESLRQSQLELQSRHESLKAISTIVNKLHRTLDIQSVVEESVNAMMDYVHSPSVVMFRLDEAAKVLRLLHARGFGRETLEVGSILPVDRRTIGTLCRALAPPTRMGAPRAPSRR
jgi:hypothetical protein